MVFSLFLVRLGSQNHPNINPPASPPVKSRTPLLLARFSIDVSYPAEPTLNTTSRARYASERRFPSSASRPLRCNRPPSPSQTLPLTFLNQLSCGATLITTFRAARTSQRRFPSSASLPSGAIASPSLPQTPSLLLKSERNVHHLEEALPVIRHGQPGV